MESLEQVDSWRKGEAETAERAGGRKASRKVSSPSRPGGVGEDGYREMNLMVKLRGQKISILGLVL